MCDSDFVASVPYEQNERVKRRYWLQAQGYVLQNVVARVAELSGLDAEQILMAGKQPQRVQAMSLVCHSENYLESPSQL